MKIEIIKPTVLKGIGRVSIGNTYTDKDADPIELRRLVAWDYATFIDDTVNEKPKAQPNDGVKLADKLRQDKEKQKPAGLNTKTAAGLK